MFGKSIRARYSDAPYDYEEIVGWYFRATLRQQFNYSEYPFDREDVLLLLGITLFVFY